MDNTENKLAELVQKYPHLYDSSQRDYKDIAKTHISWLEIADRMGMSEAEVKTKWKNIRDKFCKAKRRVVLKNMSRISEPGVNILKETRLPWIYMQLPWLDEYVRLKSVDELKEASDRTHDLEERCDKGQEKEDQHTPLPVINTSFSLTESSLSRPQDIRAKKQKTTEEEKTAADPISSYRDEDELFLLSLLPSLKRLTTKKRMEVRMKFQQVLYAAEFDD
uniref:MADF domain-containing protein n=1 Tax=Oryzias latipes TaxID=8090 RepID=A0A3P9K3B6_ORYLA